MPAKPRAGADIDAYCSRCKLVLAHVIIALRGSRPAKVECKTCRAVHAYREDPPGPRPARRGTARDSVAAAQAAYDSMLAGKDLSRAAKYRANEAFDLDDVLDHKAFGIGVVTRVLADNKIEVAFSTGPKVLVHSR